MTMTKQEIFDKGMQGVLAQEAFAIYDDGNDDIVCSYHDENGNRCMVGHLGTNEQSIAWQDVEESPRLIADELDLCEGDKMFLSALQSEHDHIASIKKYEWNRESFLTGMSAFAKRQNLTFNYK